MLGSPRFMAPEQLMSARSADAQSDVWSLGVILFCLVTGKLPFPGLALGELVAQIVRGPIPNLHAVRPGLPNGLELVIARCLERDRHHRARDCVELRRAPRALCASARPIDRASRHPEPGVRACNGRDATEHRDRWSPDHHDASRSCEDRCCGFRSCCSAS